MKLSALAFILIVSGLPVESADACSCIARDRARGFPEGNVPRNTRVLLRDVRAISKIEIVELKTGRKIPYTYAQGRMYGELTPHGLLAANTAYAVREAGREVTTFTTTDEIDSTVPTFSQLSGELVRLPRNSCDSGQRPFVIATLARHPDDRAAEGPMFAAVWHADLQSGAIDFARPPVLVDVDVEPTHHDVWLGLSSLCTTSNTSVWGAIGERFAIQLVDLAGNRSSTMTFALTTDIPRLRE